MLSNVDSRQFRAKTTSPKLPRILDFIVMQIRKANREKAIGQKNLAVLTGWSQGGISL